MGKPVRNKTKAQIKESARDWIFRQISDPIFGDPVAGLECEGFSAADINLYYELYDAELERIRKMFWGGK